MKTVQMVCSVECLPDRLECPPLKNMTSDAITRTLPHVVILVYSLEGGGPHMEAITRGFPQRRKPTTMAEVVCMDKAQRRAAPLSSSFLLSLQALVSYFASSASSLTPLCLLFSLLSHSSLSPLIPPLPSLPSLSPPLGLLLFHLFSSPTLSPPLSSHLLCPRLSSSFLLFSSLLLSPPVLLLSPSSLLLYPPVSVLSSLLLSPSATLEETAVVMCLSERESDVRSI